MENNFSFFNNTECKYYPCHRGVEEINCLFCYCPFYAWDKCPGLNEYITRGNRRIKVCTNCSFPHEADNYGKIIELLKKGPDTQENRITEKGVLYGVGVGPGDSSLITFEAARTILESDILILPAKDRESCRAYMIARDALEEIDNKECVFVPFPMVMKEEQLSQFHEETASRIEEYLNQGKTVSFLTIGDVSIYSTFDYIDNIVKNHGYKTVYVSGIPSFVAAASRLGIPLALKSECIHIVPGSAQIESALSLSGTKIFMKSGKRLTELKNLLISKEAQGTIDVQAVSNCGMADEIIVHNAESIRDDSGYLTVVIVREVDS